MDFEAQELQIKTNSALDKEETITVLFLNGESAFSGFISIRFGYYSTMVYTIGFCTVLELSVKKSEWLKSDRTPTIDAENTWRITEKADHSTLYIYCNDELVLTYVYADSPHQPGCNNFAAADIQGARFYYKEGSSLSDTASQKYKVIGKLKVFCFSSFLVLYESKK